MFSSFERKFYRFSWNSHSVSFPTPILHFWAFRSNHFLVHLNPFWVFTCLIKYLYERMFSCLMLDTLREFSFIIYLRFSLLVSSIFFLFVFYLNFLGIFSTLSSNSFISFLLMLSYIFKISNFLFFLNCLNVYFIVSCSCFMDVLSTLTW